MTSAKTALQRKNRRVVLCILAVIALMIGLVSVSVPLYRLFCQATGYNGTPTRAAQLPDRISARLVTVAFNADISPELDWTFKPEQLQVSVHPGQKGFASFRAENLTGYTLSGSAVYNVLPPKIGKYFHKLQCFCFSEQTLEPHQKVSMPVIFFIDPAFADDIDMQDVTKITLSYTFYKAETPALEQAVERFYNRPSESGLAAPGKRVNP